MRIENSTKNQSFGLKVPEHFKKNMLKIARDQKQEAYAKKKIFDIEHCLGNEYSLEPHFFSDKFKKEDINAHNLRLQVSREGEDTPIVLSQLNIKPDIQNKEKNNVLHNMFMALTPDGIKKVVKEMGNDYLPF